MSGLPFLSALNAEQHAAVMDMEGNILKNKEGKMMIYNKMGILPTLFQYLDTLDAVMDLPPEILHMIFSFCSGTDLLESVQYVCQKWREAVLSPWVWRKKILNVSGHEKSEELKSKLIQLPFLKNVLLQDVKSETLLILSENCPQLKYLLIDCSDHLLFVSIHNKMAQFDCLTYIDVSFQNLLHLESIVSVNYVSRFPPLLGTIIFRKAVSDGSFPLCLLQTCKFLEHIIISHLNNLDSWVESSLKNTGFKDKTAVHHNLHTFYMTQLKPHATEKYILILKKLSEFQNLKCLALKHNQLHDNDILQSIFKEPRPELVFLDLSYSVNLTTNAFDSVINACPNLVYLSFERCNVMDSNLFVILSVMSQLQCLNLHGTLISTQWFPSIPVRLPNLRDLNVCACRRIDKGVLDVLVCAVPNLIIVSSRKGPLKGALAVGRHHSFLEHRNSLDFLELRRYRQ